MTGNQQAGFKPNQTTPPRSPRAEIEARGDGSAKPLPNSRFSILNLEGFVETVTTIPTDPPKNFYDSIKIYTDSIATPTVRRLYIYSVDLSDWLYVTLST